MQWCQPLNFFIFFLPKTYNVLIHPESLHFQYLSMLYDFFFFTKKTCYMLLLSLIQSKLLSAHALALSWSGQATLNNEYIMTFSEIKVS